LLTEDAQAVESAYLGGLALFDPALRTSEPSESLSQAVPAGKDANAGVASKDQMVKPVTQGGQGCAARRILIFVRLTGDILKNGTRAGRVSL
jgi:hypothetical protein